VLREKITQDAPLATALEVTIEESPGQGASCRIALR
jgi:hypothetical protein